MKKIIFTHILFLFTVIINAQENNASQKVAAKIQPKIMVIPRVNEDEDMKKFYDNNMDIQIAIAKINEALMNRGGKIISFNQVKNEVKQNFRLNKSVNNAYDFKSIVLQESNADIYVEVKMDVKNNSNRNAKSVNLLLECYQVGTGNILATKPVTGPMFQTEDVGQLVMLAVDKIAEEFLNQMQASFDDILENGQSIYVEFTVAQDSDINLESKIGEKSLSQLLDEWFRLHTVNESVNIQGDTDLQLIFSDAKIPVRNPKNPKKNYNGRDFFYEIESYLDSINVKFKKIIGTNNKILISIL
jgi:hypothetical protein